MKRIVNKNGTDTSGSMPEIAVMKEISTLKQKDSIVHYYRLPDGYTLEYEVGGSNDTMPIRKDGVMNCPVKTGHSIKKAWALAIKV